MIDKFHIYYKPRLNDFTLFLLIISTFSMWDAYNFINSYSINSAADFISESRSGGYISLLSKRLIEVLLVFYLCTKQRKRNVVILVLGFFALVINGLSRSEIVILFWMVLIYVSFFSNVETKKLLVYFVVGIVFAVILSGAITVYQGRSGNIPDALFQSVESLFRYRVYSLYLSESLLELPLDENKYLFPFFGFLGERFSLLFFDFDNLISSNNSTFVSDMIFFNDGDKANALYPWWSWFVYAFGGFGLIYKFLFSTVFLIFIIKVNLPFTFLYFLYLFVIKQFQRHPLINATDFYGLLGVVIFEIVFVLLTPKLMRLYKNE
ncbi:oligosaccharide repeat unit polymerase [Pseudoalteromonas sp. McH1-7]|uniref:oligosaccharide repeat unit polymerase n=1 Tax=Pseudoalteromonas sp. McH1-7 TaxID=2745574 RepID=UPI001591AFE4|nr:oligosaccharide repeat unit polymerase [Pseudoalteromonas sp. McH1-7]NUZ10659.1 oligosaccharide repeat unit polymerase [Pseudoalteromonas sp. McH1-7]